VILAIDTTREAGSIALVEDGRVLDEELIHAPDGFGHILYGRIAELLARRGVKLERMEGFAAAAGPGSFTGVRIGLACVKGLGEALGRPVVGVSNLEALAVFGSGPVRAALIDARRGEIYGGLFDAALRALAPEVVTKLERWLETLPAGAQIVSADQFEGLECVSAPAAIAGAIGRIAEAKIRGGEVTDRAAVDANYVRRSDAELLWKEPE
jgi:tRNA threonylcarbamoyladenosine biosynthesis protein TsaB